MLAKVSGAALAGIEAYRVEVELDLSNGLPAFAIVGLGDTAVQESKERVRSAVRNSGYEYPARRIVANLAPADIRKEGPHLDLPIAIALLAASEQLDSRHLDSFVILGELALDGQVRPIHGTLAYAIALRSLPQKRLIVPAENAPEASLVEGIEVYPVETLAQAVAVIEKPEEFTAFERKQDQSHDRALTILDFSEVKGQESAKRALEVAAAGMHNLILIGPPGSGKTMLARRLPGILPPLSFSEALEVTRVHSVAGLIKSKTDLLSVRPFRSPHHSVSNAGLVGGGSNPRPGEISLSHRGVLFLDELLEFKREALEVLRQPLEDRVVTIARAQQSVTYPADFMLVASMNPCPCGYRGDILKACTCTDVQSERYWSRLSGPLLDRIDIHLEVPRLKQEDLLKTASSEPSEAIRDRVMLARDRQLQRFEGLDIVCNAQMRPKQLKQFCQLDEVGTQLLKRAIAQLSLSARAYDRILRVARTIADLAGSDQIRAPHVAEAIQYRTLDRARRF